MHPLHSIRYTKVFINFGRSLDLNICLIHNVMWNKSIYCRWDHIAIKLCVPKLLKYSQTKLQSTTYSKFLDHSIIFLNHPFTEKMKMTSQLSQLSRRQGTASLRQGLTHYRGPCCSRKKLRWTKYRQILRQRGLSSNSAWKHVVRDRLRYRKNNKRLVLSSFSNHTFLFIYTCI